MQWKFATRGRTLGLALSCKSRTLDNIADTSSLDTTIKKALEMLAKYSQSNFFWGSELISALQQVEREDLEVALRNTQVRDTIMCVVCYSVL